MMDKMWVLLGVKTISCEYFLEAGCASPLKLSKVTGNTGGRRNDRVVSRVLGFAEGGVGEMRAVSKNGSTEGFAECLLRF